MPARENYFALPYGWRDILIGSEEALRWLGRSTFLKLSDELDICIASSRAVQEMYGSMSKRYTKDEYYRRKLEHYNGLPEAYEYTKALVLKSLASASEKPVLANHRPDDYFAGARFVYVWFDKGTLETIKSSGFRRCRVCSVRANDGYLVVAPPKNAYYTELCVATHRAALLREDDMRYLCHDLNFAQFYLSFCVYDDSIFETIFANLMRFRDRFPVPPDYLVESPQMPKSLGVIVQRGSADYEFERLLRRRDYNGG